MLSVYTNQKDLLKATSTTEVSRLESVDKQLLDIRNFSVTFKDNSRPKLELHVYTPDGIYLTGNHNTLFTIEDTDTSTQANAYKHLAIDTAKELETLGINKGQYRLVYNLFDNVLGGFDSQKAFIKEISPSRRELRIQLADSSNTELVSQLFALRDRWTSLEKNDIFDSFVLNFGFNETYQIINFRFEIDFTTTPELFVRLYEPLPARYGEKSKVYISEEIISPFLDSVSIVPKHIPEPVTTLAGPNFDLEQFEGGSVATSFKSWNDLLAANASTSQQIVDNYFSGSLSGIKLNIDYRYFDNFVHYGSAVERVKNFKYKLELIEYYSQQIQTVIGISDAGPTVDANLTDLYGKRNGVVSSFDDFEKYLFFESTGSKLYSFYDVTSSYGISSSIDPWPKNTFTTTTWVDAYQLWSVEALQWNPDPYEYFSIQESVNSTVAQTYYENLLEIATIYDTFNVHKLENTIPIHIRDSEDGEQYVLFINMLSQHFDILWTYIKSLTSIHTREEHPKDGMPNDLLHHVASSMGFDLLNGKSASELWKYSLGVDETGAALQDNVNGITSISDEDNTKEIWRRLVNNLPYILKSKGTSRSIKALLSCFGIPSTVLTIKEYGGPSTFTDNDHYPEYVHDVYHYAWKSESGSLEIPARLYNNGLGTQVSPNVLEFRFKTDANYTYDSGSYYDIASSADDSRHLVLKKETNDDNQGTLIYYDADTQNIITSNLEIFDNSWHTVALTETFDPISTNLIVYDTEKVAGDIAYMYDTIVNQPANYWRAGSQESIAAVAGSNTGATTTFSLTGTGISNKISTGIASIWMGSQIIAYVHIINITVTDPNNITIEIQDSANNFGGVVIDSISANNGIPFNGSMIQVSIFTKGGISTAGGNINGVTTVSNLQVQGINLYNSELKNSSIAPLGINFPIFNDLNGTDPLIQPGVLDWNGSNWSGAAYDTYGYNTTLNVVKSLYGKTIYLTSGSSTFYEHSNIGNSSGLIRGVNTNSASYSVVFASGSRNVTPLTVSTEYIDRLNKFNGHFHEIRLWSGSLNANTLKEHAASPATYTYNVDRATLSNGEEAGAPYTHLLQRWTLANKVFLSGSIYQLSGQPNRNNTSTGSLYFKGYTDSGSIGFEGFEETYYTPSPSLGGSSLYTNKVRVESASLDSNLRLNTKTRIEKSSYDRYSIDSNRLGVYFSPQTAINEDIFNQLGYFEIDDYIGNPGDTYNDHYTDLNNFAIQYWKKYDNRNDFEAYFRALEIYDFTLFKYIKQLLPQRSNAITGLVIEPNVLERNKVKLLNKPVIEDLVKSAFIEKYQPNLTSEYSLFNAEVSAPVKTVEADINLESVGEISYSPEIISEFSSLDGLIEGAVNVDRLGTNWVQHRYVGVYKLTESGSYYPTPNEASPYGNSNRIILNARPSTYLQVIDQYFYSNATSASLHLSYSSSLKYADIRIPQETGWKNARYNGSKLTGAGININSSATVDGGPVVKVTKVNPNQIVFSNNQITTIDQSVTGVKNKSI